MSEEPSKNNTPFPGWGGFLQALRERTLAGADVPGQRVDTGAVYYPLIGLVLGAAALLVDRLCAPFGTSFAAAAIVAVWAISSRGRSLLAPARSLVAAFQPTQAKKIAALEAAPRAGVWLIAATVAAGEVGLLTALDHFRAVGLLFAPMLGHCAMVVTATGSRQARADERALKFSPTLTFREFGVASTVTFAAVFLTTDFLGLLLVLATGLLTIGLRLLWHYLFGGVTITNLAALGEVVQWSLIALLTRL